MNYIYALVCPIEKVIRYIGKAANPEVRFVNHITTAKTGTLNHHNARWIRKLLRQGLRPELKILAEVKDGERWQDVERKFIADAKKQGWRLTNIMAGGEGGVYIDPSKRAEVSAKMSVGVLAAWADPIKRGRFMIGMRDPDLLARRSVIARKINADPVFKAKQSETLKRVWSTQDGRTAQSERSKRAWGDEEKKSKRIISLKKAQNRPEVKARLATSMAEARKLPSFKANKSAGVKAAWADPSYRAKIHTDSARKKMSAKGKARWQESRDEQLKIMNDPARTTKLSAAMTKRNADPMFRAKMNDPTMRARQAATLKETWRRRKLAAQQKTEPA